ncbi:hypothetical protein C8J56DRAFT_1132330 [Mycena floridula]|nr:hypothetical protein C8J56DRAFT_1132330 [Mycena floridula]
MSLHLASPIPLALNSRCRPSGKPWSSLTGLIKVCGRGPAEEALLKKVRLYRIVPFRRPLTFSTFANHMVWELGHVEESSEARTGSSFPSAVPYPGRDSRKRDSAGRSRQRQRNSTRIFHRQSFQLGLYLTSTTAAARLGEESLTGVRHKSDSGSEKCYWMNQSCGRDGLEMKKAVESRKIPGRRKGMWSQSNGFRNHRTTFPPAHHPILFHKSFANVISPSMIKSGTYVSSMPAAVRPIMMTKMEFACLFQTPLLVIIVFCCGALVMPFVHLLQSALLPSDAKGHKANTDTASKGDDGCRQRRLGESFFHNFPPTIQHEFLPDTLIHSNFVHKLSQQLLQSSVAWLSFVIDTKTCRFNQWYAISSC